jgi:L-asparaginase II
MSIVAKEYRGQHVDLTHIGHVAVVDYTGKIIGHHGDPNRITFARSSAKPIQTLAVIESGAADAFGLSDREIALICASHSGESFHVEAVRSILSKAGLNDGYLQCGTHIPFAAYAAKELNDKGLLPQTVHCNCSGKHSGMLVTAAFLKEDLDSYYKLGHPVQKRITTTIAEVCEYEEAKIITAVDGCGVPVHALPLYKFAQGIAKLSKPQTLEGKRGQAARRIIDAMTSYPEMVAGTDRLCTDLMNLCGDRLFAKSGAAAFYAVGIKDKGIGIAFKIEDGSSKILNALVVEVLRQLEVITADEFDKLSKYHVMEIKNHKGELVGRTKMEFKLIKT